MDDDAEIRALAMLSLEAWGYEVRGAADGAAAFDEVARWGHSPDVVLLDVMMPGMSGWEFCARSQADPAFGTTAFVLMSANDANLRAPDGAPVRTLAKPFQLAMLHDTVREAVEEAARRKTAPWGASG